MAGLSPVPKFHAFDAVGVPLIGGLLYSYAAGTSTPLATYTDYTGNTANANPVVLDARGEANVWLSDDLYKLVLKDSLGNTIWTVDHVSANGTTSGLSVANYAALSAFDGFTPAYVYVLGAVTTGDGGQGLFYYDSADTTTAQDGGNVRVTASGDRYKRDYVGEVYVDRFSGTPNGTDDNTSAFTSAVAVGRNLRVSVGTYRLANVSTDGASIVGTGINTILKANGTTTVLNLGNVNTPSQWAYKALSDLTINGDSRASDGITFASSTVSDELSGRWAIERVTLRDCRKAVYKPYGNIGNAIRDCAIAFSDYGYYSVGQTIPLMHGGCDSIDHVQFNDCDLAAIYIDSAQTGTGGTTITGNTIIEYNDGFGIFVKNYGASFTPLLMDGVWFEGNATSPSVTINGTAFVPKDIYLENCAKAVLLNSNVRKIQLVNSRMDIENCAMDDASSYDIDSTSMVTCSKAQLDGGKHPITIESISCSRRILGNFAARFLAPPRILSAHDAGQVLLASTYSTANTYSFPGTFGATANSVADGRIFDSCAELTIVAGNTCLGTVFTLTVNKYYVFTVDTRYISGTLADLVFNVTQGVVVFCQDLDELIDSSGLWTTLASVGKCTTGGVVRMSLGNSGAGSIVLRLSAMQVIEFDTEQDMLDYYNGRYYKTGTTRPRVFYSTAAPTTGTWAQGDECINSAATVGQPKSWKCTVAGTPGTWVSTGNL